MKRRVLGVIAAIGFGGLLMGQAACSNSPPPEEISHPNSASTIRSIPLGSSEKTVRSKLGKPSDEGEFASEGGDGTGVEEKCLYYDDEDFDSWQLCFANGKLARRDRS